MERRKILLSWMQHTFTMLQLLWILRFLLLESVSDASWEGG
jgi:hypothetical protein